MPNQASNNWFTHVNDLRGNITAIAPDKTGAHIYVLYGAQDNTGTDRIYLTNSPRRGHPGRIRPACHFAGIPARGAARDHRQG